MRSTVNISNLNVPENNNREIDKVVMVSKFDKLCVIQDY